ncbi:hypothetical protein [Microbacterium album]|uniref:DUF3592 domain-containing protein n=1 Tax=Microbacterium album TaxID=2053191 RepID=A0A917IFE9_9MICO|nr:hypothetical protein [Microbacterium album]GGH43406.1 hypothetical protein GCM10010921_17280 [Microbacterium album]
MAAVVGAVTEILGWVGLAAAAVFGGIALIVRVVDGTWEPVRAVIIGDVLRWFGEDEVHEAPLTPELRAAARGDEVAVHYRVGAPHRVRLEARSPWPRLLAGVALACGGVGVSAFLVQLAVMIAAG